jgi:hypothetical protein
VERIVSAGADILAVIDGLIAKAPELRKAGVLSLAIGDFACTLRPAAAVEHAGASTATADEVSSPEPLSDPLSYGLPPGSRIPGFDPPERAPAESGGEA